MKIAIDITPLQGPHRYRGIGYTILNFINNISSEDRKKHDFVLIVQQQSQNKGEDIMELLDLENLRYEIISIAERKRFTFSLPGKLKYIRSALNQLSDLLILYFGDKRFNNLAGADIFIQMAPEVGLPKKRKIRKLLMLYDIIPYIIEWDYMWSYTTARKNGFSRFGAIRCKARRVLYRYKTMAVCHKADVLLAISEQTKQDYVNMMSVKDKKIVVTPLGIESLNEKEKQMSPPCHRYVNTSWGYFRRPYKFDDDMPAYLLFIGGADPRRKIDDLVAAFNRLRAEGENLKLVLAGNIIRGSEAIPVKDTQFALRNSSYTEDIVYLGFVTDSEREWLYKNAVAYVYPSKYEGFGLPILEAMQHGTPVITYRNSSITEAAGDSALYASSYNDIYSHAKKLLTDKRLSNKYRKLGIARAKLFSWRATADNIIKTVIS